AELPSRLWRRQRAACPPLPAPPGLPRAPRAASLSSWRLVRTGGEVVGNRLQFLVGELASRNGRHVADSLADGDDHVLRRKVLACLEKRWLHATLEQSGAHAVRRVATGAVHDVER